MCEVVLIYEIKGSVFLFCMKGLVGAPQQCSEGEDWRRCKMGSGNLTCLNLEKPLKSNLSAHTDCKKYIFKGIVHPKMKILSLITYPYVVPNL